MRSYRFQAIILALSLLTTVGFVLNLAAPAARAQADLGSIAGVVTDASGAVIPNAQIAVTNPATGAVRTSVTNGKGEYTVTQLLPATYILSVTAQGFASAKQTISVTVGSQNTAGIKLAVAGGTTVVTVAADDFAGIQLEKPEISAVIETKQILEPAHAGPQPLQLWSPSPATSPPIRPPPLAASASTSPALARASVDILLDGVENTDLYAVGIGQTVPMDATSEIRIVTSNSGAEYGRGSGAVNVSTKSGTNGLHGSVYEFNRISTLASDGYNNNYLHA